MKIFNLLKRWINMCNNKSAFHVKQGVGLYYSKHKIKGYYNDLTNKVVCNKTLLDKNGIPINITVANIKAYFPITIFQYGLGLYDMYLKEKNEQYLIKFLNIAEWAIVNIDKNGMWDCMGKLNDRVHETQSSMCQSEGASLLLRAFIETKKIKYFNTAKKAIDFMITDIKSLGTTSYENGNIIFQEYVSKYNLSVLNGWIFSIFGLYDFTLINNDKKYTEILNTSINSLTKLLKKYDRRIWSNYDLKGTIASPSYHDLHIMQLKLLYDLFEKKEFKYYADKWERYQNNKTLKFIAIIIKFKQKIFKNKYYDINTSLVK